MLECFSLDPLSPYTFFSSPMPFKQRHTMIPKFISPALTSPLGPESSSKLPMIHFTEIFIRHVKLRLKSVLWFPSHLQPAPLALFSLNDTPYIISYIKSQSHFINSRFELFLQTQCYELFFWMLSPKYVCSPTTFCYLHCCNYITQVITQVFSGIAQETLNLSPCLLSCDAVIFATQCSWDFRVRQTLLPASLKSSISYSFNSKENPNSIPW